MGGVALLTAWILGGAISRPAEEAEALSYFEPDLIIATNHAGRDREGRVDHWASFHVELLDKWVRERREAGREDAGQLWVPERRSLPRGMRAEAVPNWRGSSGLLAVTVAMKLGVDRAILCGIPMTREGGHYDRPAGELWREAGNYRRGWEEHADEIRPYVRSLGGWTAELLGRPPEEWRAKRSHGKRRIAAG